MHKEGCITRVCEDVLSFQPMYSDVFSAMRVLRVFPTYQTRAFLLHILPENEQ